MSSEYNAVDITRDAVAFADSQFGRHYLSRLANAKKRALDDAMNLELTDSYRANRSSQAAAVQAEIDYFATARTVSDDPTMMQRLRDAVKRKEQSPSIDL